MFVKCNITALMKVFRPAITLIFLMLCLPLPGHSQQLTVIELKYRMANEIIPVIVPFLGSDDTLSGQGNLLFLTTNPDQLSRIQAIISRLDIASRQLMITVVQGENAIDTLRSVDVSAGIGTAKDAGNGAGTPENSISIGARNTQSSVSGNDVQRVRVQEGNPASILIGQSVPVKTTLSTHRGGRHVEVVEYRDVLTGISVIPRLSGARFTLEIFTRKESLSTAPPGAVGMQHIQTQINGTLGEWIEIGGLFSEAHRKETGLVYGNSGKKISSRNVFLKVEEIR